MVTTTQPVTPTFDAAPPAVQSLTQADLRWALAEGWRDFNEMRGDLVFIGLLYPAICLLAVLVTFNDPLVPLFFPLVAGLSLAGPGVASGFYELAHRREAGQDASWRHFLDPLRDERREALITLGALLGLVFCGWLLAAYAIFNGTMAAEGAVGGLADFASRLFTTTGGWAMIVIGNLAGLGFAIVALAISITSFPMAVDHPVNPGTAMRTSIAVVRANPGVAASWGLRVVLLLALATIPLGLGLAVVLPWLGYATWHLYTRAVAR